jgi:hypothetical protein
MDAVRKFLKEDFRWAMDKKHLLGPFLKDTKKIDALVQITNNLEEYPLKEYASYALTHLQKGGIDLSSYRKKFIDTLFATNDQTVLRNVTNMLSHMELSPYKEFELLDLLLSFVSDPKNKVALHVYSIYILSKFAKKYPDLEHEIRTVIMNNSKDKTPAYRIAIRNFERLILS